MKFTKLLLTAILISVIMLSGIVALADNASSSDVLLSSNAVSSSSTVVSEVSLASSTTEEQTDANGIKFTLFKKLAEVEGLDLALLIGSTVIALAVIIVAIVIGKKPAADSQLQRKNPTRALVYGALALSLSFALSYIKLFEMPFGGSITLCSMLPLILYCAWFGPAYGFTAAIAYSFLQIIQGVYVVHPIQFVLDYILAFSAFGLASFFPGKNRIPLGILVAGFARLLCSVISGVVFFAEYAPKGMNVWAYSIIYNGLSLGVDTIICIVVYIIPPVKNSLEKLRQNVA